MALSCGAKCAKGVLIVFNLIFWLSGCALIAVGIFILIEEEKSILFPLFGTNQSYADLQYLAFGFIGIGGLVFIVGFFGCCGAMQENKCMLIVYLVFLFIILGAELAVGILAIFFRNKSESEMENKLIHGLQSRYGEDEQLTKAIDFAQVKFKCCGMVDSKDYEDSVWQKEQSPKKNVSPTCCVLRNADSPNAYLNPHPVNETFCQREDAYSHKSFRHTQGCLGKLKDFLKNESFLFIAIGIGIAFLQVFGIIFSICLCKEI